VLNPISFVNQLEYVNVLSHITNVQQDGLLIAQSFSTIAQFKAGVHHHVGQLSIVTGTLSIALYTSSVPLYIPSIQVLHNKFQTSVLHK